MNPGQRLVMEGTRPHLERRIREAIANGEARPPDLQRDRPPLLFPRGLYRVELQPTRAFAARQRAAAYVHAMAAQYRRDRRRYWAALVGVGGTMLTVTALGFVMSSTGWGIGTLKNIGMAALVVAVLVIAGAVVVSGFRDMQEGS